MQEAPLPIEPWSRLLAANEALASARSFEDIVAILRHAARDVAQADGIAVILRDGEKCHYVAEDAMEPLWAGQRFPAVSCISGWSMMNREMAVIPDIFLDERIPQAAYRTTFVRSLVMVPIGVPDPVAALGAYWPDVRQHDQSVIARLQGLARAASIALQNVQLLERLKEREHDLRELTETLERRVEERTAQLSSTQDALRQSQKLEAMGQLTGGVAHDFNNLLTPIMGGVELVLRKGVGGERETRLLEGALEASHRAKSLVQRLLAFARRQPLTVAPVDLSSLLLNMRTLIETTLGAQISLDVEIPPDLPLVRADANQIEVALLNLVLNARDAMSDGGHLTISAEREIVAGGEADNLAPGDYVRLSVTDDGCGMDEETRLRATEPFFSTKGIGKGSGLGLAMVHGLVTQLQGGFALTSAKGIGSSVKIWLPVSAEGKLATPALTNGAAHADGGLVLLVDDDDRVRAATAEMLADLGYDVVEANSGAKALRELESNPEISFLVSDHVMPGMNGVQLAARVRQDRPEIGILLISGYADLQSLSGDFLRLEKPFRQADLAASLHQVSRKSATTKN